jgi:hypothetical protein
MKEIIRMNQLAGIITEGQARKMMQVLGEGIDSTDDVTLVKYGVDPDNQNEVESYKKIGFELDYQPNDVIIARMSFKGYDWLAVLAAMDDCMSMGLNPLMEYNGRTYTFEAGHQIADEKASGDEYDNSGVGRSSGRF